MSFLVPPRHTLTRKTEEHIEAVFPSRTKEVSALLISECGNNLPFLADADALQLERVRFAVLKISEGDWPKLLDAVDLAKIDWRDLLAAAEFADDPRAHLRWSLT